jgi:hypothetical protein
MPEPKKPSDLLGAILEQAGVGSKHRKIDEAVATALGPDRSASVRVRGFRRGKLVLEVDSAPLFSELRAFGSESLRQRINDQLDGEAVASIAFRMGGSGHR